MTCPSLLNGRRCCPGRIGTLRAPEPLRRSSARARRVPVPDSACRDQRHFLRGIKPVMEPETAADVEGRPRRDHTITFFLHALYMGRAVQCDALL